MSAGPSLANFNLIDASTGLYTVGPITDPNLLGTYTIEVTAVTINGVAYVTSQLLAPFSFTLTVLDACSETEVTSSSVSSITLIVFDL